MKNYIKKTLVVLLIALCGLFIAPQPSRAFLGFGDVVFDPANLAETIADWAAQVAKWVVDEGLVVMRDAVVKRIVDDMTDDIITSIDNEGTPLFVQDFGKFMQRSGDVAFDEVNRVLIDEQGLDLCVPFQPQLRVYLQTRFRDESSFGLPVTCSFEQFRENLKNTTNFIENGGWFSFQEAFYPGNNLFGAELAMEDAMTRRMAKDRAVQESEANMGNGFLSVKRCTQWKDPTNAGKFYDSEEEVNAAEGPRCKRLAEQGMADTEKSCLDIFKSANCSKSEVKTPGQVVAESATKGVLKDFEYASNVQSILSAFINKMIGKTFDAARGLLSSDDSGSMPRDYSSGTEQRIEDRYQTTIDALLRFENQYFEARQNAEEINSLADADRKLAVQAIYNCYHDRWGAKREDTSKPVAGPPTFGWLVYNKISSELFTTAVLGDLIDSPIPASYTQYLFARVPDYDQNRGAFPPPASSYPAGYPPHKGYFEKLLEDSTKAKAQANNYGARVAQARARVIELSKATSSLELASSTTEAGNLLSKASREYAEFMKDYSMYILQSSDAGGPGESSKAVSLNQILRQIAYGLATPGYIMDGIDFSQMKAFYYCESR
jgi:hypothetical protein